MGRPRKWTVPTGAKCPEGCNPANLKVHDFTRTASRLKCHVCGQSFSIRYGTPAYRRHLPAPRLLAVIYCRMHQVGRRDAHYVTGANGRTVARYYDLIEADPDHFRELVELTPPSTLDTNFTGWLRRRRSPWLKDDQPLSFEELTAIHAAVVEKLRLLAELPRWKRHFRLPMYLLRPNRGRPANRF